MEGLAAKPIAGAAVQIVPSQGVAQVGHVHPDLVGAARLQAQAQQRVARLGRQGLPVGESGLAGSIVLAIMALPTIVTVAEDAMRNCPRALREASLALGASRWQTVAKVVIPPSMSGIASGVVLGIGRAIGETMAVIMVAGNQARMPQGLLKGLRTLTANIVTEMGYATGLHREALIATGVVLFVFILIINLCLSLLNRRAENAD